ncbi:MAG: BON domain-containing protein [Pseudodesulfovibrio sp.]|nr:BON domain-containing protein [Pseudodesulfovibrio sp.]
MNKHIVIIAIMLFALFSGGCAVVPVLLTSGASFAVPQTVSLAITAAGTVHKTVLIAADERNASDMLSDKMLTIQAQALLLDESGTDIDASCLNGDMYLVGEYVTLADRDHAIEELQTLKGVKSVKGVLKPMPTSLAAMVEPAITDKHAETVIESGLLAALHIKSANVDVEVVQGEAFIVGVVKDKAEADAVVDIVKGLRPKSDNPVRITSLLAFQEAYEADVAQENAVFVLLTRDQVRIAAAQVAKPVVAVWVAETEFVDAVPLVAQHKPELADLYAIYVTPEKSSWQKARFGMKRRIASLASEEIDPCARKELITLSTMVFKDRHLSIEDRLIRTLHSSTNLAVKERVCIILDDIAPHRSKRIHTLAMN